MRRVLILACFALLLASPAAARIDQAAFDGLAFRQHPGGQLPLDAQLRDQSGRPATLAQAIGGKPAIVVLEYLRCQNLCSLVLSGATTALIRAHLTPGKQVDLVAISIDPRDTSQDVAAAAAMYSRRFPDPSAASGGIRFLTGSPDQVKRIADAVGFPYRFDRQSNQYAHPAGFVVTTSGGRISRYLLGLNPPAAAVGKAVAAADEGTIEPPAHPLLCLCFGYDPDEGSVAALTWQLVRMVSFAVLLATGAFIGALALRRRAA